MFNQCKHEEKRCPGCGGMFECKVGDIANCQCNGIQFNTATTNFISKEYDDCLCRNCLLKLNESIPLQLTVDNG